MKYIVYDATCSKLAWLWKLGATLYQFFGVVKNIYGAQNWAEALSWLEDRGREGPIQEIQFWGHGSWGRAVLGLSALTIQTASFHYNESLKKISKAMTDSAIFWFRSGNIFGAKRGKAFAEVFSQVIDRRVAGHTFIVWVWHSGLHVLEPGVSAKWDSNEGVQEGNGDFPEMAAWSLPWSSRSISFLKTHIPERFFRS